MTAATVSSKSAHTAEPESASVFEQANADRSQPAALRRDDFDRNVWCLLGLPVDIADIDRGVAEIDASANSGSRLSFVTPNVNWLVRAHADPVARREMIEADLSFIDGAPLVLMARMLGVPAPSRVAGSDIFEALRRRPGFANRRTKVLFFGGRDGAAQAAFDEVNRAGGGVEAVGAINPGHGDVESMSSDELIAQINAANADFVIVALGAAKGQRWISRNQSRLNAPVIAHLGAVIDFAAGSIERAPRIMQKLGLEWAWRIKEEPLLWKRYFQDGLKLAQIALSSLLTQSTALKPGAGKNATPTSIQIEHTAQETSISPAGHFTHANLFEVRNAFRAAVAGGRDVELDFGSIVDFDRAFLGLVLMLEKHVARNGRSLYIKNVSQRQKALLKANMMDYPVREGEAVEERLKTAEAV